MKENDFRRKILARYGATDDTIDELLEYTESTFRRTELNGVPEDEPFVGVWREYADDARKSGAYAILKTKLVQLSFPIEAGISTSDAYLSTTRMGAPLPGGPGLCLERADALRIEIHETPAGSIPLLIIPERRDFVTLVQALVYRNEPCRISESMGACMVSGYNNWDRIRSYKRLWTESNPGQQWKREFERLAGRKELYQDRFILLSDGPYSGISAEEMGMPAEVWREASLIIRREHECAHYYTRRMLGSMRNNVLDELIADYMGIRAVSGHFRSNWFLRFMGLEEAQIRPQHGRFAIYTQGVTNDAARVLKPLLIDAARSLEKMPLHVSHLAGMPREAEVLKKLTLFTLEELAAASFQKDERPVN